MCKKNEEQRIVVLGAKGNLGTPVTEELKRAGFTDVIEWTRETEMLHVFRNCGKKFAI